jgi:hypothetical protein
MACEFRGVGSYWVICAWQLLSSTGARKVGVWVGGHLDMRTAGSGIREGCLIEHSFEHLGQND